MKDYDKPRATGMVFRIPKKLKEDLMTIHRLTRKEVEEWFQHMIDTEMENEKIKQNNKNLKYSVVEV